MLSASPSNPTTATIKLPPKLVPVFEGAARVRGAYGGRGSGKTRSFAKMTAVRGYEWGTAGISGQILCAREHLNSLDESSFEEVKEAIRSEPFLAAYYEIGERYIRSRDRRIAYTFAGLRHNIGSLKSKSRILLAWVDEAEGVSETAWRTLMPTVREDGSEVWVTWNPESKQSPTHKRFRETPPEGARIAELNWRDNPWFPNALKTQRLDDKRSRPNAYDHVWEGDFLTYTEGAYYLHEMQQARDDGRIGSVPHETGAGVITAWDLGFGDATAIWFLQVVGLEVRAIDYYENDGKKLAHYADVLSKRRGTSNEPYNYIEHVLPHDGGNAALQTGRTPQQTLGELGLTNVTIARRPINQGDVDRGIEAVRNLIPKMWFAKDRCERGIECLRQYRHEWDDRNMTWKGRPLHDWASHGADALRTYATGFRGQSSDWSKPMKRNMPGIA